MAPSFPCPPSRSSVEKNARLPSIRDPNTACPEIEDRFNHLFSENNFRMDRVQSRVFIGNIIQLQFTALSSECRHSHWRKHLARMASQRAIELLELSSKSVQRVEFPHLGKDEKLGLFLVKTHRILQLLPFLSRLYGR